MAEHASTGDAPGVFVDSHCHLDYPGLAADADAVVERARTAGVRTLLTISTRLSSFSSVWSWRAATRRSGLRLASIRTRPRKSPAVSQRSPSLPTPSMQRSSPSANAVSTTSMTRARETCRRERSAPSLPRQHGPDCRSSFTPATPTQTRPPFLPKLERRCPKRRHSLLQHITRAGSEGGRARALSWCGRHPDLQALGRAAGHRPRPAARTDSAGDRRSLPRARALSRQAQRARLHSVRGSGSSGALGNGHGNGWTDHDSQLLCALQQGRPV